MAENSAENSHNLGHQPQFELPQAPEQGQESRKEQAIEKRQVTENTPAKSSPKFPTQAVAPQLPSQAQQTTQDDQTSSKFTAGLTAQDADLIEKQWVERAKSLVSQTQDDPYKQNEMSKIKADYIKKRFNKTIPVEDSKKS
jgi:hypothetical protein